MLKAIEERRAVRHFDPNHPMTEAEIDTLMNLTLLAPTAFTIQNWRFVLVRDPELRKKISAAAGDQAQVTHASLLIILCADMKTWEINPVRHWGHASRSVKNHIVLAIDKYYRGCKQVQRNEGMRAGGLVAQTLMLAAKEMGYDSFPLDGFDDDAVGKAINLPPDHVVAALIVIGKPMQSLIHAVWQLPGQLQMSDVVINNRF